MERPQSPPCPSPGSTWRPSRAGHTHCGHRAAPAAPQSPRSPSAAPQRPDPLTDRLRLEQLTALHPLPPPRSRRVAPEGTARDRVRTVLGSLQRGGASSLPGQRVPVRGRPQQEPFARGVPSRPRLTESPHASRRWRGGTSRQSSREAPPPAARAGGGRRHGPSMFVPGGRGGGTAPPCLCRAGGGAAPPCLCRAGAEEAVAAPPRRRKRKREAARPARQQGLRGLSSERPAGLCCRHGQPHGEGRAQHPRHQPAVPGGEDHPHAHLRVQVLEGGMFRPHGYGGRAGGRAGPRPGSRGHGGSPR